MIIEDSCNIYIDYFIGYISYILVNEIFIKIIHSFNIKNYLIHTQVLYKKVNKN